MSLQFNNVSVGFRRYAGLLRQNFIPVVQDVDFAVSPGELVGVVGASGAGKSLLAQAVLDYLPPNAVRFGDVALDGEVLAGDALERARGSRVALAPQSLDALDPLLPIGRQIQRLARLSGCSELEAQRAARQTISRYGLSESHLRAYPHELSGGMARRALLATATAGGAQCLIADEPTVGLDAVTATDILAHLRALADEGRTVLVISHDLPALVEVADRIVSLRNGQMVEDTPARLFRTNSPELAPYGRALWDAQPANGMARVAAV